MQLETFPYSIHVSSWPVAKAESRKCLAPHATHLIDEIPGIWNLYLASGLSSNFQLGEKQERNARRG